MAEIDYLSDTDIELRDKFAMSVLPTLAQVSITMDPSAVAKAAKEIGMSDGKFAVVDFVAKLSYQYADAMLKARKE